MPAQRTYMHAILLLAEDVEGCAGCDGSAAPTTVFYRPGMRTRANLFDLFCGRGTGFLTGRSAELDEWERGTRRLDLRLLGQVGGRANRRGLGCRSLAHDE